MDDSAREERQSGTPPRPDGASKPRTVLSGREARQGDIILDTPAKRAWFIGVLAACVVLLLVLALAR
jgi:hypothetical protein